MARSRHRGWASQNGLVSRSLQKTPSPVLPQEGEYLPFPQSTSRPTREARYLSNTVARQQGTSLLRDLCIQLSGVPLQKLLWLRFSKTGAMVASSCERFLEITKLKPLLSLKKPKQINHLIKILACKFTLILQHLQALLHWVDA